MNPDIDAVIFDFGGVLSSSVGEMMASAIAGFEIPLEEFLPIALGVRDGDGDHPWHRMERGEITFTECADGIAELAREAGFECFPSPPDADDVLHGLRPADEMLATARAVREAGYRTAILTNNFREMAGWREMWNADELVDVVIESFEVGMRKPAREIYELTLDRLGGVPSERALFLDDFPWNIAGAEQVGLQAGRDDRALTLHQGVGFVRGLLEDQGQTPAADDEPTPDLVGDPVCGAQPVGHRQLAPHRRGPDHPQPLRQSVPLRLPRNRVVSHRHGGKVSALDLP